MPTCGHDCCASGAQLLNSIVFCYRNPSDKMSLSFGQKCPKVFYSFLSNSGTAFQGNVIWNHETSTLSFLSRFNRCDFKSHLSINRFYTFNPVKNDRVQLVRFQITPNGRISSIGRNSLLRFQIEVYFRSFLSETKPHPVAGAALLKTWSMWLV